MGYDIEVVEHPARPTAVVALATTWTQLPAAAGAAYDDVRAFLAGRDELRDGGRNVVLYRDAVPHVEVGVLVARDFDPSGRVRPSVLPGGAVARTLHQGSYEHLPDAHAAVRAWCADNGYDPAGPRWEVYGDWHDDEDALETEVAWLLSNRPG